MCQLCDTHLTYGQLYDIVYNEKRTRRDDCVRNLLSFHRRGCLRLQHRMVRNLNRMIKTQAVMTHLDSRLVKHIANESASVRAVVTMRTRRLSRFMLRHTYRPNGRMFFKGMGRVCTE